VFCLGVKARERRENERKGTMEKCGNVNGFRTSVLAASTKNKTKTKVFKKINNTSEDSNRSLSART